MKEYKDLKVEFRLKNLNQYDKIVEYRLDPNQDLSYYEIKRCFIFRYKKKKYYIPEWKEIITKSNNYLYCNNLGYFEWLKTNCDTIEKLEKYIKMK